MPSIISGEGLGLFNKLINPQGQGDSAHTGVGKNGDKVYVNSQSGNLVIQRQDEFLKGAGIDLGLIRTYNSQGLLEDDNNDNWRLGLYRSLENPTPPYNTEGATITKVYGDGARATFTYDSNRGHYYTTDGLGAHDTLEYDAATSQWIWSDGTPGVEEIYNSSLQLIETQDVDGKRVTYEYEATLLKTITDWGDENNPQVVTLDYNGYKLEAIETYSDGRTQTRVTYDYDTNSRLEQVKVDLTPETGSDNSTFVTTYTYDGPSKRIASITNSDGTSQSFAYERIDDIYKITSITDGEEKATTFAYSEDNGNSVVTITDPLNQSTKYTHNSAGLLEKVEGPVIGGNSAITEYEYDNDENLIQLKDAEGNRVHYEYDSHGNVILEQDSAGNRIDYRYNAKNQKITETHYKTQDQDGYNSGNEAADPVTQYYVYDTVGHLRFHVSAEGRVTEYRYTNGLQTSVIEYLDPIDVSAVAQIIEPPASQADSGGEEIISSSNSVAQYLENTLSEPTTVTATPEPAVPVGNEFHVNTSTAHDQELPDVARLEDGGYVIVWQSRKSIQAGGDYDVYGQMYNQDGTKQGGEFKVTTYDGLTAPKVSVTGLTGGGFAVTWGTSDGSLYGIARRVYNANGVSLGDPAIVNTETYKNQEMGDVSALANGGFVVTWTSGFNQDGANRGVFAQRYDASGTKVDGEFQVNSHTPSNQWNSAVTGLAGGGFVIAWQSNNQDGSLHGIYGQRYDSAGAETGPEFLINSTTSENQQEVSLAGLNDGGFIATWHSAHNGGLGIFGQRYDAAGVKVEEEFQVSTHQPIGQSYSSVTNLEDGGFFVTWISDDSSSQGVYGQQFDADSNKVGDTIQINTHTEQSQKSPSVVGLNNGGFVVTWDSRYQEDGGSIHGRGVYAQQYSIPIATPEAEPTTEPPIAPDYPVGPAQKVGDEFFVTPTLNTEQYNPSIAHLNDGGFVITWESKPQDASGYGIFAQRYDAEGVAVDDEFRVNTTESYDERLPTVTGLKDGGFVISWQTSQDGWNDGIHGQQFDAGGSTVGSEFLVNTHIDYDQTHPSITALDDGGYVVTWYSRSTDPGVFGQRFNSSGLKVGDEFKLNSNNGANLRHVDIASLSDGGFIATWESEWQEASRYGVFGQRFDSNGSKVDIEFQINTSIQNDQERPAVTGLAEGGFVVTWQSGHLSNGVQGIFAQRYNADGNEVGFEYQVSDANATDDQYTPSITSLRNGGYLITWQDGDSDGISAQLYNSDGRLVGERLHVESGLALGESVPVAAGLNAGGFVIAWQTVDQGKPGNAIHAQRFNIPGPYTPTPIGPVTALTEEFLVNTETNDKQESPSVGHLSDGGFVIVWQSDQQDGYGYGAFGQRYNSDGEPVGDEFQINDNSYPSQKSVTVTGLDGGGFVVTWTQEAGSSTEVYARIYNAEGVKTGSEFLVNSYTSSDQSFPNVASLEDGGFVVTWRSKDQDGDNFGVYGQRYNSTGVKQGDEFRLNSHTTDNQLWESVTGLEDGGFVAVWDSEDGRDGFSNGIFGQRYSANGDPVGPEFQVNSTGEGYQKYPSVSSLKGGGFFVTWESTDPAGSGNLIYGQRYHASGGKLGSELLISTSSLGAQTSSSITGLDGYGFLVTWKSHLNGIDSIYGKLFDADANPVGEEFKISSDISNYQTEPSIRGLEGGKFVVSWQSYQPNGDSYDIYGRLFEAPLQNPPTPTPAPSPNNPAVTSGNEFQVNTIEDDDQSLADVTRLSDGGFIVTWQTLVASGSTYEVKGQKYNASGDPVNDEFKLNISASTEEPKVSVAELPNGAFVVVWGTSLDGSGSSVSAQIFDYRSYRVGVEFVVNSFTNNDQINPSVTALSNGEFVVTWESEGQDGSEKGIYGQRFNAQGEAQGGELFINAHTPNDQIEPAVASLQDGRFIVAWQSDLQDNSGYGIYAQQFNANGSKSGFEIPINTTTTGPQSNVSITGLRGGGFVVTWESADSNGFGIHGQRYNAAGDKIDAEFLINTQETADQLKPEVTALNDGGYFVSWHSSGQDGSGRSVHGQQYDSSGLLVGDEIQINSYTSSDQLNASVSSLSNGGFVVVWDSEGQDGSGYGIFGQRYSIPGAPIDSTPTPQPEVPGTNPNPSPNNAAVTADIEFQVNTIEANDQTQSSVTRLSDGNFIVTWQSVSADGNSYEVKGQKFTADGVEIGSEFPISVSSSAEQPRVSVAELPNGGYVVVWGNSNDGSMTSVSGRIYNYENDPLTDEFVINSFQTGHQLNPSVTSLTNGEFVVTWESIGQDGFGSGIYGKRYSATGDLIQDEFSINAHTTDDQMSPSISKLQDGGFVVAWQSDLQDGSDYGIYAQRFNANGIEEGIELSVNATKVGPQSNVSVAGLRGGGFVVTWESIDSHGIGIYGQRFDVSGNEVDSEFLINTEETSDQLSSAVTALNDGGFFVSWHSNDLDGSARNVYGQQYDSSGRLAGEEIQINSHIPNNQQNASVSSLSDGGFVVIWESLGQDDSGYGIFGQRYTIEGAPADPTPSPEPTDPDPNPGSPNNPAEPTSIEFQVNTHFLNDQSQSSVTRLSDGSFIVTWQSISADGNTYEVKGQKYNADGDPINGEFPINSSSSAEQPKVSVAELPNGGFVLVWGNSSDQSGSSVSARVYDYENNPLTPEFVVNSHTGNNQLNPSVTSLTNGEFVVTWQSEGQDGSGNGIYGKRYSAAGELIQDDFIVNYHTANDQIEPSISRLQDGGFIVAWQSEAQDNSGYGVYAQRFNASGAKVEGEIPVNTSTTGAQTNVSVAGLRGGGFVATWESADADGAGIYAQRFDASGNKVDVEFLINTEETSDQVSSAVTALNDGGFFVSWHSNDQDGSARNIYGQQYDAFGRTVGDEVIINTHTTDNQLNASVSSLSDGGFVVIWDSEGQDNSGYGIFGRRYTIEDAPVDSTPTPEPPDPGPGASPNNPATPAQIEFQVNTIETNDQTQSSVTRLSDGNFIVTWQSVSADGNSYEVKGQKYTADGDPIDGEFPINTSSSAEQPKVSIAELPNGGFVVVWGNSNDGSGTSVSAKIYSYTGAVLVEEFVVNDHTTDRQFNPSVTPLSNGHFVVTWDSVGQDGSGKGIHGQRYNALGEPQGVELDVTNHTSDDQMEPSISKLEDGGFIVAWQSDLQDNSGYGIYAQRYNANGFKVDSEIPVHTNTLGPQTNVSVAGLRGGGFVATWESADSDGMGIYGQRFDETGRKIDFEFLVNTEESAEQLKPEVTALNDGGFFVSWHSNDPDSVGLDIYGQQYDSSGRTVGQPIQINTLETGDQLNTSVSSLSDGGFVVTWDAENQADSTYDIFARRYTIEGSTRR